jgi:AraC-like DNA-binding protein
MKRAPALASAAKGAALPAQHRPEPTVFSPSVGMAVWVAAQLTGREPAELCAALGLSAEQAFDPARRLPHSVMVGVWEQLGALDEDFGLRVAQRVAVVKQSLVEYAIANASNGRAALETFLRYQRLLHDAAAHRLLEEGDRAVLSLDLAAPLRLPRTTADFLAALVVLKMRSWLNEPIPPIEVALPRRHGSELAREVFRAPIALGAPRIAIRWPRRVLHCGLSLADPALHLLLSRQLDAAAGVPPEGHAAQLPGLGDDLVIALRREIKAALPRGASDIDAIARRLGMSPRSLQRHLRERDTSFREVLDDVRRRLAEGLLAQGGTIPEVALMLAFAQTPAFVRAFRRWTGTTPAEFARRACA